MLASVPGGSGEVGVASGPGVWEGFGLSLSSVIGVDLGFEHCQVLGIDLDLPFMH